MERDDDSSQKTGLGSIKVFSNGRLFGRFVYCNLSGLVLDYTRGFAKFGLDSTDLLLSLGRAYRASRLPIVLTRRT